MKYVVEMQFGSHVCGTNVPTSDRDYKAVYLPDAQSILLQRVSNTVLRNTKKDPGAKNSAEDVDIEIFSLQRYLELLMEGQTVALDMLFTPESFYTSKPHAAWRSVQENRLQFLHRGVSSFGGYCRTQAAKYGVKGSRLNAVRRTLEFLGKYNEHSRLKDHEADVRQFAAEAGTHDALMNATPLVQIVPILNRKTGVADDHLEVCNRKLPLFSTIKYAKERLQAIYDEYGHRARLAETNQGVDWKALMHAVRVCEEGKELLLTGHITFPRPEKELLLQIRKGELPYKEVAEKIETGLVELEAAALKSSLPQEPNRKLAEELVTYYYGKRVCDE